MLTNITVKNPDCGLYMLYTVINATFQKSDELLVLYRILLLIVKSSLGNQSGEKQLIWKEVGLL